MRVAGRAPMCRRDGLEQAHPMPRSRSQPTPRHRVVIVGGGFGGIQAARRLRRAPVDVTLIDRRNFHLFQPLLYQVAAGAVSAAEIAQPLRSIFRRQPNVSVILGEVYARRSRAPPRADRRCRRRARGGSVRHADRRRRLPLRLLRPRRVAPVRTRDQDARGRARHSPADPARLRGRRTRARSRAAAPPG